MDLDADPDVVRLRETPRSRTADRLAVILEPTVLVPLVIAVVAICSSSSVPAAAAWWLLTVVICVVLPYTALLIFVARGAVLDRHVVVRRQRLKPLLVATAFLVAGLVLLGRLGAPRPLLALVLSMLAGLAVMLALSVWYKASFHVAVPAGAGVVLGYLLGPWSLAVTVPVLVALVWARLRAGRHSVGQVVVGLVVGVATAAAVYPTLS